MAEKMVPHSELAAEHVRKVEYQCQVEYLEKELEDAEIWKVAACQAKSLMMELTTRVEGLQSLLDRERLNHEKALAELEDARAELAEAKEALKPMTMLHPPFGPSPYAAQSGEG